MADPDPVPDEVPGLAARDRSPLPEGALLRFQTISRSPDPRTNLLMVVFDDGRVFRVQHSRDTQGEVPMDRPLPDRPSGRLTEPRLGELRALLEGFAELPSYQERAGEGGEWRVVTARVEGGEHEVVLDRASSALADRLQQIASQRLAPVGER